jgi:capsid protein
MPMFSDVWTRPERYNTPHWQARAWSWVDPAKEMKAMEMSRALQLQTHAEQIMEYTGNDFMSTMTTISKENELKQELGLSGGGAPAPTSAAPLTETPGRNIEPLYLEGEDEPINLRTDLSAAAKQCS